MQQGGRGNRAAPVRAMQHAQPPQAGQQHGAAQGAVPNKRGYGCTALDDVLAMDADAQRLPYAYGKR